MSARRGMPLVASWPMHSARIAAGRALLMVLSTCKHMLQTPEGHCVRKQGRTRTHMQLGYFVLLPNKMLTLGPLTGCSSHSVHFTGQRTI